MNIRLVRALPALCMLLPLALGACGKKDTPPGPTTPPATTAAPATDAPPTAPPATDADATTPVVTADAEAAVVAPDTALPPAPTAADGDGDWIVWFAKDGGWVSRWLTVTGDAFAVVAEKKAVVLSDGARLWRLERRDAEDKVSPCVCLEEENSPDCKPVATLTRPGLWAVELSEAEIPTAVRAAVGEGTIGDGIDVSLALRGGLGARLVYAWGESGYMCGAHGMAEGASVVFDLAAGAMVDEAFKPVAAKLPASVREPAAKEMLQLLQDCDGPEVTLAVANERMALDDIAVGLDASGAVSVAWGFSTDVMYACSADYLAHGTSHTSLVPEAAEFGLGGPLPRGLVEAFKAMGATATVGWSRLTLTDEARAAALARFQAAPEATWPPDAFHDQPISADAPSDGGGADSGGAVKAVNAARKLTREKKYAEAVAEFGRAISLSPDLATAYSGRGYAHLLKGDLAPAKSDFEKALTLDKSPIYQAQVWYNLGQLAEKQKDVPAARAAYLKSQELRPSDAAQKAINHLEE